MHEAILEQLPYKAGFRFVDSIDKLDGNGSKGRYTLREDAFFYSDHFPGYPVTPGVILTEIMAQIGLVVLGLYLLQEEKGAIDNDSAVFPLLSSTDVSFFKMVLPGETVTVVAQKKYFRFHKLKCYIEMFNADDELVAKGTFAGMMKTFTKPDTI